MPKNPFQRPQPINHNHNVPRHGLAQKAPPKLERKSKLPLTEAGIPPLDQLLHPEKRP